MRHLVSMALMIFLSMGSSRAAEADRQILICVASNASPSIHSAAEALSHDADQVPLLRAMRRTQGAGAASVMDSATVLPRDGDHKAFHRAAFNHLILIGLPQDPLLAKCWGYMTRIDAKMKRVDMEGYGALAGDLGWVECDRNPFLHSQAIDTTAFDTMVIKLSGTSEAGVLAAIAAFRHGMANGLTVSGALGRPEKSLLDLDPLPDPPPAQPERLGVGEYAGWTQCSANEYRAFIDAAGVEPAKLWRLKWLMPKSWDAMGARSWLAGMHRMSFGSAANIAEFADAATAMRVAEAIGKNGKPYKIGSLSGSELAAPSDETLAAGEGSPVRVIAKGRYLIMSTLDATGTAQLVSAIP